MKQCQINKNNKSSQVQITPCISKHQHGLIRSRYFSLLNILLILSLLLLAFTCSGAHAGSEKDSKVSPPNNKKQQQPPPPQQQQQKTGPPKLIYAVNAGGNEHIDVNGFRYQKDPLEGSNIGVKSDYGNRLHKIKRIFQEDEALYRTERYSLGTFGYDLPVPRDGKLVLVLKFCEVYFKAAHEKIFDVTLNDQHIIIPELDIYNEVEHGVAHDEIVAFEISGGRKLLTVDGQSSPIKNNKTPLKFVKGDYDNPKINAFYLLEGSVEDVPKLPKYDPADEELNFDGFDEEEDQEHQEEDDEEDEDDEYFNLDGIPTRRDDSHRTSYKQRPMAPQKSAKDPWEEIDIFTTATPIIAALLSSAVLLGVTWKMFRGV